MSETKVTFLGNRILRNGYDVGFIRKVYTPLCDEFQIFRLTEDRNTSAEMEHLITHEHGLHWDRDSNRVHSGIPTREDNMIGTVRRNADSGVYTFLSFDEDTVRDSRESVEALARVVFQ